MKSLRVKLANTGVVASTLCAIECAITPFILMALPFVTGDAQWQAGLEPSEPTHFLEWVMMGLVSLFAFSGIVCTFSSHKQWRPVIILAIGFCILLLRRLGPFERSVIETVITFVGTGIMIWAGMLNRRLIQPCACHSHHTS
ncbi:MAG: MerC domain-containing protein [Nitrospirales bacterium]|nr:MerC domain-containing protein [Nitrospirales bacterium]